MLRTKKYFLILSFAILFFTQRVHAQFFGWNSLGNGAGNGTNGVVNAIVKYNNLIIVGGFFTKAGNVSVNNIASWNGSGWSALGNGVNDTIFSLSVFNGNLIAGGKFTSAGGNQAYYIASWNGTNWSSLSAGMNNAVLSFSVFNGNLICGGRFTTPWNYICSWNGSTWSQLSTGLNNTAITTYVSGTNLYVGGKFTTAGGNSANRIAKWDNTSWSSLGTGMDDNVYAITGYGGYIVAGGSFSIAGGNAIKFLAEWNGSMWSGFSFQLDSAVYALTYYSPSASMIVGGSFLNAGSLFVDRICKWDGGGCSRMVTGTNNRVNFMTVIDTSLFIGGNFTTAGGDYSYHTSVWQNQVVHTVTGTVRYADTNRIVTSGIVKTERMDVNTREIIVIDSAYIQSNGTFSIHHGISDSTDVVAFPNDENVDDFVPTYYPSTINWANATRIYPSINLSNIDIYVYRVLRNSGANSISGHVYLNYNPILNQPGYPFSKDAIIYAKQGSVFRSYAVTDSTESYVLLGLTPGSYDLFASRIGYVNKTISVNLTSANLDTINFYLDTTNLIGIRKISSNIPSKFKLYQNYPNPFNPVSIIKFDVESNLFVTLKIYNELGQVVSILVNETMQAGEYKISFDASSKPSGVYFYELNAGGYKETKKMVLIK